ncbi:hypothetical protein [Candidatus Nanohalovita haloferacivicina]|uniref:DNA replication complex subunit Gins51 n=1 Tax=Candidatus Nanohalovita haloferacivicina TaxID=2978046 RepID=UPI00325FC97B|nr:DNA replication factor GINS [Candidatus Nanohalobia archaeon BNXNv]
MSDNALTFSELRKIQKEEKREEDITELGDDFLLRVSNYLRSKKESSGEGREYRNAKRVFEKIISLREDKIVKNAKISVKTESLGSDKKMLPREKELYRQLKEVFNDHRSRVDEIVEDSSVEKLEKETEDEATEEAEVEEPAEEKEEIKEVNKLAAEEETEENEEEAEEELEEGYTRVEITSEVPEFMGTDLETYGPFDQGDQADLPDDNAEILVNRGNAEEM